MNNNSILLTEGGLGGHISHIYEDLGLTFSDFFKLLKEIDINFKSLQPTEKFDGINLFFSVNGSGETVFARNSSQFKDGGLNLQEFANYLSEKSTPEQFKQTLLNGAKCLCEASKLVAPLFGGGNIFMNVELVSPQSTNVINYDKNMIVIHRVGNKTLNEGSGNNINSILGKFQKPMKVGEFTIFTNPILNIEDIDTSKYRKKLLSIISQDGLNSNSTMESFLTERLKRIFSNTNPHIIDHIIKETLYKKKNKEHFFKALEPIQEILNSLTEEITSKINSAKPSSPTNGLAAEGIVFLFNNKVYKLTGKFASANQEKNKQIIKEQMPESKTGFNQPDHVNVPNSGPVNGVSVLFPGGFRPPHKGHLNVILNYFSEEFYKTKHLTVEEVIVIMSDADRGTFEGTVSLEQAIQTWNLYLSLYGLTDKVKIKTMHSEKNWGPLNYVADFVINKERDPKKAQVGNTYVLATSKKDSGRYEFLKKYLTGKEGWNILYSSDVESDIVSDNDGKPLSSSDFRKAIYNRDINSIKKFVPDRVLGDVNIYNKLLSIYNLQSNINENITNRKYNIDSIITNLYYNI